MIKTKSKEEKEYPLTIKLFTFAKKHIGWSFLSIAASILSAISNLLSIYLVKKMIDDILIGVHTTIAFYTLYLIFCILFGVIAQYFMKYASGKFGILIIRDLREKFFSHIERLPIFYIEKEHVTGDLISRFTNDLNQIKDFFVNSFSNFIYYPCIFTISFLYMLTINWKLLLLSFSITPLLFVLTGIISKPIGTIAGEFYEKLGKVNTIIQDHINGISIIKAYNLEKSFFKKSSSVIEEATDTSIKLEKRVAFMQPLHIIMYEFPSVLCVLFGGNMAFKGVLSAGSLIAFMQLLHYVIEPTAAFPRVVSEYRKTISVTKRIFQILDQKLESTLEIKEKETLKEQGIEFEHVYFGYSKAAPVLKECSFQIEKGKITALVGVNGSGKSTIINLICGFYEGYQGIIKLFGKDIKTWPLEYIRENIAVVTQDTYLFPDTVANNIMLGMPEVTYEDMIKAAKISNANDFITKLPNAYDTYIGERGSKLSKGQQQRIGIARAILKNAPILLLDEPLSSMDAQSEDLIKTAIQAAYKNKTVLIIAHQLSTIKEADNILVLDKGRIIEKGTHNQLIEKEGKYYSLWKSQCEKLERYTDIGIKGDKT